MSMRIAASAPHDLHVRWAPRGARCGPIGTGGTGGTGGTADVAFAGLFSREPGLESEEDVWRFGPGTTGFIAGV